jgi:hypothetical protein
MVKFSEDRRRGNETEPLDRTDQRRVLGQGKVVNRRSTLTLDRRLMLTPLIGGIWR